jgi:predicted chitinase
MRYHELNNSPEQYILYVNGKPSVKYDNLNDAIRDQNIVTSKYPRVSVEIKQQVCRLETVPTTLSEALSRRDFLKGLGAAAGLSTLGYGAYQQKQRPMTDPGGSYTRDPVNKPTSVQNEPAMATTQPQQQTAPTAPAKPERVIPKYSPQQLERYIIDYASKYLPIDQCIQFLAQCKTETDHYRSLVEYDSDKHEKYQGGAQYKGRGYIQLTHLHNYEKYGKLVGKDLVNDPDLLLFPNIAAQVSVTYWKVYAWPTSQRLMRRFKPQFPTVVKAVTRVVNGGYKKLNERQKNVVYYTRMLDPGAGRVVPKKSK